MSFVNSVVLARLQFSLFRIATKTSAERQGTRLGLGAGLFVSVIALAVGVPNVSPYFVILSVVVGCGLVGSAIGIRHGDKATKLHPAELHETRTRVAHAVFDFNRPKELHGGDESQRS